MSGAESRVRGRNGRREPPSQIASNDHARSGLGSMSTPDGRSGPPAWAPHSRRSGMPTTLPRFRRCGAVAAVATGPV
jgi:hypothetical protein